MINKMNSCEENSSEMSISAMVDSSQHISRDNGCYNGSDMLLRGICRIRWRKKKHDNNALDIYWIYIYDFFDN